MKIFETAYVPEHGGAAWINSSHGQLFIDTKGMIWGGFPQLNSRNLLNPQSQIQAKQDILTAEYVNRNGYDHIVSLLNQSNTPKEEILQTTTPTVSTIEEAKKE